MLIIWEKFKIYISINSSVVLHLIPCYHSNVLNINKGHWAGLEGKALGPHKMERKNKLSVANGNFEINNSIL